MSTDIVATSLNATSLDQALENLQQVHSYEPIFRALVYWTFNQETKSLELLKKSLEEALEEGHADIEFITMVIQGLIYNDINEDESCYDCFEQAELILSINNFEDIEYQELWRALYHRLAAEVYLSRNQWSEALNAVEEGLAHLKDIEYQRIRYSLLYDAGMIYKKMNKHNLSLSYFHELLFRKVDPILSQQIYEEMVEIHQYQGNLNISLYYLYRLLKGDNKVNSEKSISIYTRIASIFITKGMYEDAESIVKITQKIYQDIGDEKGEIWSKFQLAISEFRKGNWQQALDLFHENQDNLDTIEDRTLQGLVLKFIGDINRLKGDLPKAKENFTASIKIFTELQDRWNSADVYNKIGLVHFQEGEKKKAHRNFQKSLAIFRKIGDSVRYSEPIFNLIRTKLDLNSNDQAEVFLSMLENISDRTDNELIHQRKRLATALILKNKERIIQKVEAQKILSDFVNDNINDAELSILGMINLCDLLLAELHLYQQSQVLEEILELSEKLVSIAVKQKSLHIQIEAVILKARLSMISGDISKASSLLEEAMDLAEDANLAYHMKRIKQEKDTLMEQLDKWEILNKKSASIREKMEMANIQNYMESLLSTQ